MDSTQWDSFVSQGERNSANPFTEFVKRLDHSRLLTVYIRKSGMSGDASASNYLLAQQDLPHLLSSAGFPGEKIVKLQEDTGISASLTRLHRPDLQKQHDLIISGQVGTVVALDVARLFRDEYYQMSSEFARICGNESVILLCLVGETWTMLDMSDDAHRKVFFTECETAAAQRKKLRSQMLASREQSARNGNYAGGPIPFGWAVHPGVKRNESPTGKQVPPRLYVYPAHKEYRLEVWRRSMLPNIESYADLQRHLRANGLSIPPFDAQTAKECLHMHSLRTTDFHRTGSHYPSIDTIVNILHDPLAVGFRLYGSGAAGKSYLNRQDRLTKLQGHKSDSRVKLKRECIGNIENLALWVGGSSEEKSSIVDLFLAVQKKWSKFDFETLVRTNWRDQVPNPYQTAGKPTFSRVSHGASNPWARRVVCLRHTPQEGTILRHTMAMHSGGDAWECYRDRSRGIRRGACSQWGDSNRLGRILDLHLHQKLRGALATHQVFIESIEDSDANAEKMIRRLKQEIEKAERRCIAVQDTLEQMQNPFDLTDTNAAVAEAVRREQAGRSERYRQEKLLPLLTEIATKRMAIEAIQDKTQQANDGQLLKEALGTHLDRVLCKWQEIEVRDRMEAIQTFVQEVGVWVGDGQDGREALVKFQWKHGECHYLISWRSAWQDRRKWTEEEYAALRELWPSTAPWEEIAARLQPGRKFITVYNRAWSIGAAKGSGRPMAWYNALKETDQSWGDKHPDVLYLDWSPAHPDVCQAMRHDGSSEEIEMPSSAHRFVSGLGLLNTDKEPTQEISGIGPKKYAKIAPLIKL